jgi:replicative DNA helicase
MNAHVTTPNLYEIELEQALLGAVLLTNRLYWKAEAHLTAADFYEGLHGKLWACVSDLIANDRPADAHLVTAAMRPHFEQIKAEQDFDPAEYLWKLIGAATPDANVDALARTIADLARRRCIVAEASAAIDAAYHDRETPTDRIADQAAEAIYEASRHDGLGRGPEPLIDVIRRAAQAAEESRLNPGRARITTGIPSIDNKLGGFFPRDLHVLGAASSMGKSGLVGQMSLNAAWAGYVVLVFSIEMASEEFATRYLAMDSGVPANRIAEGRTSANETAMIAEATTAYSEGRFFLDGSSNLSMAQIRGRAQATRRRHGQVDLIVIDHLRLVRAADPRQPEHERLDQLTKDAKAIAKDFAAAVLVIAPVNRELWKRENHRPIISDLYGASAIEYNADHVWFLHREEFYLERNEPAGGDGEVHAKWLARLEASKGKAEVFGAKRRGGPLGAAHLMFDAPLVRFYEPDAAPELSPQERFL